MLVFSYREEGSLSPFKAQRGRGGRETCIPLLAAVCTAAVWIYFVSLTFLRVIVTNIIGLEWQKAVLLLWQATLCQSLTSTGIETISRGGGRVGGCLKNLLMLYRTEQRGALM